mmetsp:Transcript_7597/g.32127  ORF Transcript_7597/g.32127 Transcript_7597/m.32127 type:complete len:283 (+) Transcript_7597:1240-2088(+)
MLTRYFCASTFVVQTSGRSVCFIRISSICSYVRRRLGAQGLPLRLSLRAMRVMMRLAMSGWFFFAHAVTPSMRRRFAVMTSTYSGLSLSSSAISSCASFSSSFERGGARGSGASRSYRSTDPCVRRRCIAFLSCSRVAFTLRSRVSLSLLIVSWRLLAKFAAALRPEWRSSLVHRFLVKRGTALVLPVLSFTNPRLLSFTNFVSGSGAAREAAPSVSYWSALRRSSLAFCRCLSTDLTLGAFVFAVISFTPHRCFARPPLSLSLSLPWLSLAVHQPMVCTAV